MSAREVLARLKCREAYVASGGWSAIEDHVENAWSYYLPNADRDIAALRADGYELVPTKPTVDMLNAAVDVDSYKLGDINRLAYNVGGPIVDPVRLVLDHISSLSAALATAERERDEARADREALQNFWHMVANADGQCDGNDFWEWSVATGLMIVEPYDPAKHGDNDCDMQPGDDWHIPTNATRSLTNSALAQLTEKTT